MIRALLCAALLSAHAYAVEKAVAKAAGHTRPGNGDVLYLPPVSENTSARFAITSAQTLAIEAGQLVQNAKDADLAAMTKCGEAAKTPPKDVNLPDPRDAAGMAAYTRECKSLGVDIPFRMETVAALEQRVRTVATEADRATIVRLQVGMHETESWRLPAEMEQLRLQTGALIQEIAAAKLGVKAETIAATKKAFQK